MSPPPPMDSKPNSSSSSPAAAAAKKPAPAPAPAAASPSPPCGACKFLRRKCAAGCVFAPHFGSDQGSARFAAVHKVFGASNVSKLLQHVPPGRRHDAVVTICYEAQARLSDPVYGCVSTILALQQQVASLQAELSIVQSQLINSKLAAVAGTLQSSQQITSVLQPAYSNNSAASTNMPDPSSSFPAAAASLDLSDAATLPSRGLEPLQLSGALYDEEEENQDPAVFTNGGVFHPK